MSQHGPKVVDRTPILQRIEHLKHPTSSPSSLGSESIEVLGEHETILASAPSKPDLLLFQFDVEATHFTERVSTPSDCMQKLSRLCREVFVEHSHCHPQPAG